MDRAGEVVLTPERFNSRKRVTAQELRAKGAEIDPKIPDCAWVPRSAVSIGAPDAKIVSGTELVLVFPIKISAPFTWYEATIRHSSA